MLQMLSSRLRLLKRTDQGKSLRKATCAALLLMLSLTACRRADVWSVQPGSTDTRDAAEITIPSAGTEPQQTDSPSGETRLLPETDSRTVIPSSTTSETDTRETPVQNETEAQTDPAPEPGTTARESSVQPVTASPETEASETDAPETGAPTEQKTVFTKEELSASVPRYVYSTLSDPDREQYLLILNTFLNREEICTFPSQYSKTKISRLIEGVLADYPEIFWTTGAGVYYFYQDDTKSFLPEYILTEKEISEYRTALSAVRSAFLRSLSPDTSEYEKAISVFEYLVRKTHYDTESYRKMLNQDKISPVSQTLCNALLDNYALCTGYAKAAQYLLHACGMEATFVTGTASGSNHAWIFYRMNGSRYFMDACWGDPVNVCGEDAGLISYLYFAMSDDELFLTHSPDVSFKLPVCAGGNDTYFLHNHLWFDTYDRDALRSRICSALSDQKDTLSIRFSNLSAYEEAVSDLFTNNHLLPLLLDASDSLRIVAPQVSYSLKEEYLLITLHLAYPESES